MVDHTYCDDIGIFAPNLARAQHRDRILQTVLRGLKKPFSCKQHEEGFQDHMILAGLHIDKNGVRVELRQNY